MIDRPQFGRWSSGLLLILFAAHVAYCQDGICKKGDIPTNYVAVEEFTSPQCDYDGDPFAPNAWRAEPVKDGKTVCELPRYEVIGPRVAELLICEVVQSDRCKPRLDGLPNAMVLRSPTECIKRKLPKQLEVKCSGPARLGGASTGYMVAQLTSPNCPPAPAPNHDGHVSTANAWLAHKVSEKEQGATWLSVCANDFNISDELVVRRFNNVNCPENNYVEGGAEGLNGWIIIRHPKSGPTYAVCAVYTKESWKPLGPKFLTYQAATDYVESCGGMRNRRNSLFINVGPDGTLFRHRENWPFPSGRVKPLAKPRPPG